MNAVAHAIELGRSGFAVFPCRLNKHPACRHGFKQASADTDEIRALWEAYPGPLVGVATGLVSYLAVLDVDGKHREAHEWFRQHRDKLPPTRTHRTCGGGLHLLYGTPEVIKCSVSKICKGIDVRGDGGYVIWWPAACLEVLHEGPCAPWPEWLSEKAAARPHGQQPGQQPGGALHRTLPRGAPSHKPHNMTARIEGLVRLVAGAPEGERNNRLFWAACRVAGMNRCREVTPATAGLLLDALHAAALHAGLDHANIRKSIDSALKEGRV